MDPFKRRLARLLKKGTPALFLTQDGKITGMGEALTTPIVLQAVV